ncbi:hypothetical protein ACOTWJ_09255 [Aliarcobacter butzleri]
MEQQVRDNLVNFCSFNEKKDANRASNKKLQYLITYEAGEKISKIINKFIEFKIENYISLTFGSGNFDLNILESLEQGNDIKVILNDKYKEIANFSLMKLLPEKKFNFYNYDIFSNEFINEIKKNGLLGKFDIVVFNPLLINNERNYGQMELSGKNLNFIKDLIFKLLKEKGIFIFIGIDNLFENEFNYIDEIRDISKATTYGNSINIYFLSKVDDKKAGYYIYDEQGESYISTFTLNKNVDLKKNQKNIIELINKLREKFEN